MKTRVFFKLCLYFLFVSIPLGLKSSDYEVYKLVLKEDSGGHLIKSVKINNDLSLSLRVYSGLTMVRIDYYQNGMIKESKTYSKSYYDNEVIVPIALTNRFVISASYYAINSDSDASIIQGGNYHTMIYEIEFAH